SPKSLARGGDAPPPHLRRRCTSPSPALATQPCRRPSPQASPPRILVRVASSSRPHPLHHGRAKVGCFSEVELEPDERGHGGLVLLDDGGDGRWRSSSPSTCKEERRVGRCHPKRCWCSIASKFLVTCS
uniref:Uncharacterized protein n=3 Tax=Aegilops tauschii subsp. strangulata TaxID=200361 RepID=A0A453SP00_AEGTS